MIRKLLALSAFLLLACPAQAVTRYVSQSGGVFSGGSACNTQTAISVATFNFTAQSPDDVNILCGTITSALDPSGSGTSGHVVIIKFDSGASIQMPAIPIGGAIVLTGLSFYLIDGGGGSCGYVSNANVTCNVGVIKSTANGSGLANQVASVAIEAGSATSIEVKGLLIGPIYTHTLATDNSQSPPGPICIHFVGGNTINIHNNTMHDAGWCVNGNGPTITVSNNEIYNTDHGVALGGTNSTVNINGNHFHDWVNWDQNNNNFHHDGIHLFDQTGLTFNGANEYNNLFDGDEGVNVTAAIYNEHAANTGVIQNITAYNNVVIAKVGRFSNVGWIAFWKTATGTGSTGAAYNNTVYGAYVAGSGSCLGISAWNGITLENNSLVNCQNQIGIDAATTITTVDYNSYDDIGTDSGLGASANTFSWHGSQFASFTTWKADCSCDSHGIFNSLASLKINGSTGQQLSGSPVIGTGLNLTSLSITPLDSDILGNARPGGVTAWDIGAYFGAESVGTFATPVTIINP